MGNFLNTLGDLAKAAGQQVISSVTAGGRADYTTGIPYQGTPPILQQETGNVWGDALDKVRQDLVNAARNAARDTAAGIAGGLADSLVNTEAIRAKERQVRNGFLVVGGISALALGLVLFGRKRFAVGV